MRALMTTVYFGAFDDNDDPIGLFRLVMDDTAKTLDLERLDEKGAWVNDPSSIDELHEPEVRPVEQDEAQQILELLGASPDSLPAEVVDADGADAPA